MYVAKYWDELWLGVKGLSNLDIAGSLRNYLGKAVNYIFFGKSLFNVGGFYLPKL